MHQKLTHTLGGFCPISPKPLFALSIAAHSRFAKAEEVAMRTMQGEASQILGDSNTLAAHVRHAIPNGPNGDKPLIQYLFDSLDRRGLYLQFSQQLCAAIVTKGRSPVWSQAWFSNIYQELNALAISSVSLARRS